MLEAAMSEFSQNPLSTMGAVSSTLGFLFAVYLALKNGRKAQSNNSRTLRRHAGMSVSGILICALLVPVFSVFMAQVSKLAFSAGVFSGISAAIILFIVNCVLSAALVVSLVDLSNVRAEIEAGFKTEKTGAPDKGTALAVVFLGALQSIPITIIYLGGYGDMISAQFEEGTEPVGMFLVFAFSAIFLVITSPIIGFSVGSLTLLLQYLKEQELD